MSIALPFNQLQSMHMTLHHAIVVEPLAPPHCPVRCPCKTSAVQICDWCGLVLTTFPVALPGVSAVAMQTLERADRQSQAKGERAEGRSVVLARWESVYRGERKYNQTAYFVLHSSNGPGGGRVLLVWPFGGLGCGRGVWTDGEERGGRHRLR